jgi:hypothetical protein
MSRTTIEAPRQRRSRQVPWKHVVKATRRAEAEIRQREREDRGDEAQLARLDAMFGAGKGAQRERARLIERLGITFGGEKAA